VDGWAETYAQFDLEEADRLLDSMGLTQRDSDGFRLRPDGETLSVIIDTTISSGTPAMDAMELIRENWEKIGVKTAIRSATRELFWPKAHAGEHQIAIWGSMGLYEPFIDARDVVPAWSHSFWASQYGIWYATDGNEGEEPTGDLRKLQLLYDEFKIAPTRKEQIRLGKEIATLHKENVWVIGYVGLTPTPFIVNENVGNFPEKAISDWIIMTPGNQCPEQFFFRQ
jgi:peptide/nickel transport system substrate-binding protein